MNKKLLVCLGIILFVLVLLAVHNFVVNNFSSLNRGWQPKPDSFTLPAQVDENGRIKYFPYNIVLTDSCKIFGYSGDIDPSTNLVLKDKEWLIDCGSQNNNAREVMDSILKKQSWQFCESLSAHSSWWKNGIETVVVETAGTKYPFRIIQDASTKNDAHCN